MILSIPADASGVQAMKEDLKRARQSFGADYLLLPYSDINAYAKDIGEAWGAQVCPRIVRYSADRRDWSPVCKSDTLAWQREFRFLGSECGERDEKPVEVRINDFSQQLTLNPPVELRCGETSILRLDEAGIL